MGVPWRRFTVIDLTSSFLQKAFLLKKQINYEWVFYECKGG